MADRRGRYLSFLVRYLSAGHGVVRPDPDASRGQAYGREKVAGSLSYLVAMLRNCLSLLKNRSITFCGGT